MPDASQTVRTTIGTMLARRNVDVGDLDPSADLFDDLGLDSLELAELSAALEDDLGHDPYSEGLMPRTIGDVLAYYDG